MITKNAQEFKRFLISQDINLEFIEGDNGETIVEIREQLKSGIRLRLLVIFNREDSMVSIYGADFIQGINPIKKNYLYEAVNDLNYKYTYYKYVLEKDSISVQAFALFEDNFSSEVVMRLIMGMMATVEQEYSGLMKIIWS